MHYGTNYLARFQLLTGPHQYCRYDWEDTNIADIIEMNSWYFRFTYQNFMADNDTIPRFRTFLPKGGNYDSTRTWSVILWVWVVTHIRVYAVKGSMYLICLLNGLAMGLKFDLTKLKPLKTLFSWKSETFKFKIVNPIFPPPISCV